MNWNLKSLNPAPSQTPKKNVEVPKDKNKKGAIVMDKRKAIQIMNDSLKIMKRKYVYKENAEMLHKTDFACKATPYKVVFVAVNDEEFLDFIYEGDSCHNRC